MNIVGVWRSLAIDGARLDHGHNQWRALTFAEAVIGSSQILFVASFPRRQTGVDLFTDSTKYIDSTL